MKNMAICSLLILALAALLTPAVAFTQQCPTVVWSDEFDGTTLDTNKWEPMIGDGCSYGICGWGNNELQYYKAENATVANGMLTITAQRERVRGKQYTSARLRTLNQGDFFDGYFEARIRIPVGQGLWPAFWMLPTDEIFGGWPQSGEIDIMENIGSEPSTVHGTIHYGQPFPDNQSQGASISLSGGERFTDDFHTFAVEKTNNQIRWFMDGVLYSTKTDTDVAPQNWPFNERFHFLLNVAVGGNWPGSPDGSTQFPQTMDVDYVRVYDAGKPFITGDAIVANQEQGVVYSVGNVGGGTNVTWTVPSDATIVSGQGSSSVTVNFGDASGDVTASFNECGAQSLTRGVTVDPPLTLEYTFENFDDPENVTLNTFTGTLAEVSNPDTSGVNASANSGQYTRNGAEQYDVLVYNNSLITDADKYVSREKQFFIDLYTSAPTGTVLILQLEDSGSATPSNYPTGRHSRYQVQTSVQNQWERVEVSYLDRPDPTVATGAVDTMILLFEPNTFNSNTYTFDNLDGLTTDPGTGGPVCGNGIVETGEACDGGDLAGASCTSLGFDFGSLSCSGSCTFDTGNCSYGSCELAGAGAPCTATTNCCSGVGNCSGGRPSSRTCL